MNLVKIKDLFNFEKGSIQSTKCTPGKYNFITAASEWKTHNEFSHDCEALIFAAAASGSLGRIHYVNGKFISSDLCFIITPKDSRNLPVDLKFYHLIFDAFRDEIVRNTKAGTSKEAIGLRAFGNYKLPYFSIKAQKEAKKEFVHAQEIVGNLNSEFSCQLEFVKHLRQAFLLEAMQGKLVHQNPQDEPASVLLETIRIKKNQLIETGKIKKGKLQKAETLKELLFDIPKTWKWCKLDDICKNITDGTHQTPHYTKEGRVFLSAQNVKPFRFMPEVHKYVSESAYQLYIKNRKPEIGDLLIGRVGAGIGETAVIDKDIEFCIYVSLGLVQPFKDYVSPNYLAYVFNSPYGYKYAKGNISSKGGSAGNFNLGRIRSFLVPLPPLSEQKRIVKKLDELMEYCDQLEESIKNSQRQNELLLQQVLREALEPRAEQKLEQNNVVVFPDKQQIEDKHFLKRKILATYILNQSSEDEKLGDVKFEKLLHLADYVAIKRNLGQRYLQKTAGPYDNAFTYAFFTQVIKAKWFKKIKLGNMNRIVAGDNNKKSVNTYGYFSEQELERVNKIIKDFRDFSYEEPEIISTLYAVWNNRIIKGLEISDESLKKDFLAWDKQKVKYKNRLDKALAWMRSNGYVPDGWGNLIQKKAS